MNEWKTVRLGDVCEIQSGGTPSRSKTEYWKNGTIPWVKIGDFSGKYLNKTTEHITQKGLENSSAKLFSKGTILYSIFATLGEATILNIDATTNQAIAGIKIKDKSSIDIDYLFAYLKSLKEEVNRIGRGVAQNNINLSILKAFTFPLPPIEIQKQIAKQLNKCTTLLAKHKQMLEKYDTLIKSRFIEMFGDPVSNPMGWETRELESIADIVSGITKGRKTKETELFEVPYMAVSNVKAGYIDWTTVKTIEATKAEIAIYQLKPNDVLMAEGGDPDKVGRGALITTVPKNCIHQNHVFRVRLNQLSPIYFSQYLQHEKSKRYFLSCAKQTTGIASINMTQLKGLPVLIPSEKKQDDFASFVQQIDKSKFDVQKSLEKAETLYKSLMQEYFG